MWKECFLEELETFRDEVGLEEERLTTARWGKCSKGKRLGRLHWVSCSPCSVGAEPGAEH